MLEIRSGIAFSVGILCHFTAAPQVKHATALQQNFQYLKEIFNINIIYQAKNSNVIDFSLYSYTDVKFAETVVKEN